MPWKEVSTMSQRFELVQLASADSANIAELCRRFHISRKTAYKWIRRFKEGGRDALQDRSRRPHHSPHQTPKDMMAEALNIRDQHPAWGGRKVNARLKHLGYQNTPSPSTLTALFHRETRINHDPKSQKTPYIRFEHEAPNHLWQMDFMGHFQTQKQRCHTLTVLDDHSRFNLCLEACENQRSLTVQEKLTDVFRHYGLPDRMTMDNGSPWGCDKEHPFTPLTLWLIRLGIKVSHSRPYHPQTQGKDERFHRSLRAEVIRYQSFKDLNHCQKHFIRWRHVYNLERPHEALGMQPPVSRYQASLRSFPEVLPTIEYGPSDIVRKVHDGGCISYRNKIFRVGKAFNGFHIALRHTQQKGLFNVFFCHQLIKIIDLSQH